MALLEADVALPVVRDFVARVKDKALGTEVTGSLNPGQALVGIVHKELAATMGAGVADINLVAQPPVVVLMAGCKVRARRRRPPSWRATSSPSARRRCSPFRRTCTARPPSSS
jgi:hypothetical protein